MLRHSVLTAPHQRLSSALRSGLSYSSLRVICDKNVDFSFCLPNTKQAFIDCKSWPTLIVLSQRQASVGY